MPWDRTKPVTNSLMQSVELRNNWDALARSLGGVNLLADPTFLIWAAGDTAAPTHWALSGAGATIARTGTGLGDTARKFGQFAAKVVAGGGAAAYLTQSLLTTTSYDDGFDGLVISSGAWVKCSAATTARVRFDDGVATTASAYHTGDGTWQWLTVSHTIDVAATKIEFELEVATAGTAYISAPSPVLGEVQPLYFQPPMAALHTYEFTRLAGTLTATTDKDRWLPTRPGIIKDVQLWVKTAPTGADLTIDVNTWDGAAFTSMFSTRPKVVAGNLRGGAQPDTTYARRCVTGLFGNPTVPNGGIVSYDIDVIGSGVAGADLTVRLLALEFERPLEMMLEFNGYGV